MDREHRLRRWLARPTAMPRCTLFPTMVVGSLPRPLWVREVIAQRAAGRLDEGAANERLDRAVLFAIQLQEQAGLDYISDGEWRRENYVRVFGDRVAGFARDDHTGRATHVIGKIRRDRPIVSDDAAFLCHHASRRTIVALPSPFTVSMHLWHPERSAAAYPKRAAFVEDCAEVLLQEARELAAVGVDAIQLDEPWQAWLTSPASYHLHSEAEVREAVELCIRTVNGIAAGLKDVFLSVHLCHSHGVEGTRDRATFNPLMEAVNRMQVDRFAMEFNSVASGGFEKLRDFPDDKILGLGVINPGGEDVETVEEISRRVAEAARFVPEERMTLNPDCGFATSALNERDLDRSYRKLSVMCEAARQLRAQSH